MNTTRHQAADCRGFSSETLRRILRTAVLGLGLLGGNPISLAQVTEYLSQDPELLALAKQDWGKLGFDTAAHAEGQAGQPLRVGDRTYSRGLGHHANGRLVIWLDEAYSRFEAQVGLQPCGGDSGSVIFRVWVDGQVRFDSGILRAADAPRPVSVSLLGAQELQLEAADAGDGITCDMANWLDARLTCAVTAAPKPEEPGVDIARFAQVRTWDPGRREGTRATRLDEFPEADLRLGTDLIPDTGGRYRVGARTNGLACLGLEWLNRRALKEVGLEFVESGQVPQPEQVRLEVWTGESRWQGEWKPVSAGCVREGNRLGASLAGPAVGAGVPPTWKVRWILPTRGAEVQVRKLTAYSRSKWSTADLLVFFERPQVRQRASSGATLQTEFDGSFRGSASGAVKRGKLSDRLGIVNGEILNRSGPAGSKTAPLRVTVRYARRSAAASDPTILLLRTPRGSAGVAIADVLAEPCVYLPDLGVLVCRADRPVTPGEYRRSIAGRKTLLEAVRTQPDQTIAQALSRTHRPAQDEGPVMLSLAASSTKYVVERNGDVHFPTPGGAVAAGDWFASAGIMRPRLGATPTRVTRQLEEGWLPIPVITTEAGNVRLRQRVFVAPTDVTGDHRTPGNRSDVCVAEFGLSVTGSAEVPVQLALTFLAHTRDNTAASLTPCARGYLVRTQDRVIGLVASDEASGLRASREGGVLTLDGGLAPHREERFTVYLGAEAGKFLATPPPGDLIARVRRYWDEVLAPAIDVETPDSFLNDLIRSSQVRCWIAARADVDGRGVAPWIAAMSYGPLESEAHSVIRGMDSLGHHEFARQGLDYFIHRYNSQGFLTTGYTTFGTAWHLWTLGEHWQLTRDRAWITANAAELARVGQWILRQIAKTRRAASPDNPPEAGLLPPGVLADWNSFAFHFTMNAYYYAALRELGIMLADVRHPDARAFAVGAVRLKADLLRAYAWTQARSPALRLRNGTWIPHYPSQLHSPGPLADFFPGDDAGRAWAYDVELGAHQLVPTGVFGPHEREVDRMLDHLEEVPFLGEGWFDYPAAENERDPFNLGGFAKVQPYYARNAEIYALRDDVKPFVRSYANSLASLVNREVLTFWEHFRHSGAWDKTHETGYFLHQTRTMLVQERGQDLWLAPFIPEDWLRDGQKLRVSRAPTRFGPVAYLLESVVGSDRVRIAIDPPQRTAPAQLVVRLRPPGGERIQSVTVNGRHHARFDAGRGLVMLPGKTGHLDVEVRLRRR